MKIIVTTIVLQLTEFLYQFKFFDITLLFILQKRPKLTISSCTRTLLKMHFQMGKIIIKLHSFNSVAS